MRANYQVYINSTLVDHISVSYDEPNIKFDNIPECAITTDNKDGSFYGRFNIGDTIEIYRNSSLVFKGEYEKPEYSKSDQGNFVTITGRHLGYLKLQREICDYYAAETTGDRINPWHFKRITTVNDTTLDGVTPDEIMECLIGTKHIFQVPFKDTQLRGSVNHSHVTVYQESSEDTGFLRASHNTPDDYVTGGWYESVELMNGDKAVTEMGNIQSANILLIGYAGDNNPAISISRDGGGTYHSVALTNATGPSGRDKWTGSYTFSDTPSTKNIFTFKLYPDGTANSTTSNPTKIEYAKFIVNTSSDTSISEGTISSYTDPSGDNYVDVDLVGLNRLDAIEKVRGLTNTTSSYTDPNWDCWVNNSLEFNFVEHKGSTINATYSFSNRNLYEIRRRFDPREVYNIIYAIGYGTPPDNITRTGSDLKDSTSIASYGARVGFFKDTSIKDSVTLAKKAKAYLKSHKDPTDEVSGGIINDYDAPFNVGDNIYIVDADLGLSGNYRVTSVNRKQAKDSFEEIKTELATVTKTTGELFKELGEALRNRVDIFSGTKTSYSSYASELQFDKDTQVPYQVNVPENTNKVLLYMRTLPFSAPARSVQTTTINVTVNSTLTVNVTVDVNTSIDVNPFAGDAGNGYANIDSIHLSSSALEILSGFSDIINGTAMISTTSADNDQALQRIADASKVSLDYSDFETDWDGWTLTGTGSRINTITANSAVNSSLNGYFIELQDGGYITKSINMDADEIYVRFRSATTGTLTMYAWNGSSYDSLSTTSNNGRWEFHEVQLGSAYRIAGGKLKFAVNSGETADLDDIDVVTFDPSVNTTIDNLTKRAVRTVSNHIILDSDSFESLSGWTTSGSATSTDTPSIADYALSGEKCLELDSSGGTAYITRNYNLSGFDTVVVGFHSCQNSSGSLKVIIDGVTKKTISGSVSPWGWYQVTVPSPDSSVSIKFQAESGCVADIDDFAIYTIPVPNKEIGVAWADDIYYDKFNSLDAWTTSGATLTDSPSQAYYVRSAPTCVQLGSSGYMIYSDDMSAYDAIGTFLNIAHSGTVYVKASSDGTNYNTVKTISGSSKEYENHYIRLGSTYCTANFKLKIQNASGVTSNIDDVMIYQDAFVDGINPNDSEGTSKIISGDTSTGRGITSVEDEIYIALSSASSLSAGAWSGAGRKYSTPINISSLDRVMTQVQGAPYPLSYNNDFDTWEFKTVFWNTTNFSGDEIVCNHMQMRFKNQEIQATNNSQIKELAPQFTEEITKEELMDLKPSSWSDNYIRSWMIYHRVQDEDLTNWTSEYYDFRFATRVQFTHDHSYAAASHDHTLANHDHNANHTHPEIGQLFVHKHAGLGGSPDFTYKLEPLDGPTTGHYHTNRTYVVDGGVVTITDLGHKHSDSGHGHGDAGHQHGASQGDLVLEYIFKDDFESGNFSNWSSTSGASINSTYSYDGTYSCKLVQGGYIRKDITPDLTGDQERKVVIAYKTKPLSAGSIKVDFMMDDGALTDTVTIVTSGDSTDDGKWHIGVASKSSIYQNGRIKIYTENFGASDYCYIDSVLWGKTYAQPSDSGHHHTINHSHSVSTSTSTNTTVNSTISINLTHTSHSHDLQYGIYTLNDTTGNIYGTKIECRAESTTADIIDEVGVFGNETAETSLYAVDITDSLDKTGRYVTPGVHNLYFKTQEGTTRNPNGLASLYIFHKTFAVNVL